MKFKVLLFFALVSFSLSSFVFDNDICNPTSVIPEEIDSRLPLWFTQTECVRYFKLDHSKFDMGKYGDTLIEIGVGIPNKYNVMLLESNTSIPQLFLQDGSFVPEARYSIIDDYTKMSTLLQIVITREEILKGGISYIAVFKTSIKEDYPNPDYPLELSYGIHIKPASKCYWTCHGTCVDEDRYGKCYCRDGFFGPSCLWPTRNLTVGEINSELWPSPVNHFYLQLSDVTSNFTITFSKFYGNFTVAFKINEHDDFTLSPFNEKIRVTEDPHDPKPVDFHFDKSQLNASNTARLLIEVSRESIYLYGLEVKVTNHGEDTTVQPITEDSELLAMTHDSKLLTTGLPIATFLGVIIVGGVIRLRYKRKQKMMVTDMKNNVKVQEGTNVEGKEKIEEEVVEIGEKIELPQIDIVM